MEKLTVPEGRLPPMPPMAGIGPESASKRAAPPLATVRWLPVKKRDPDERRFHHRHRVREGAFALLRLNETGLGGIDRMSMGAIACAVFKCRPHKMGQIRDISLGGISFTYLDGGVCQGDGCKLDILVADSAFYLEDLPFRNVTDVSVLDETDLEVMKTKIAGLQFKDLNPRQKTLLKRFLRRYTL